MNYNIEVFKRQYPVLNDFIYHYISYKELFKKFKYLPGDTEFWIKSTDAHIKVSITSWCMVFGTESNATHWKKTILGETYDVNSEFRKLILKECSFSSRDWENYWKQMLEFRNQFLAHRELTCKGSTPYLDNAFKIVIIYDSWIREKIAPDYIDSPSLLKLSNEYRCTIEKTLSLLL